MALPRWIDLGRQSFYPRRANDSPAPAIRWPMKEKELRLALVCYGGVSLAVYEHGVTKEILKLVRASKAYHSAGGSAERRRPDDTFAAAGSNPEHCTEAVYFDLLKALGPELDLRVIVDVVAGSSA